MSWNSAQYDENPFSETSGGSSSSTAPLASNAASSDNPPWLQEPSKNPSAGQQSSAPTNNSQNSQASDDPSVPRMILYTRVVNLLLSVCMIVVSLLSMITTQSATTGVLAMYLVVFSCLLCCFETHLKAVSKFIALNFGFMYSAKARCIFMLFVGSILFSFSLFGKIVGLAMVVNSGFNAYVLFRYPGFEDAQRTSAQSEISDFLSKNPAFAEKMVKAGAQAGAEVLRRNPDLARKGAEAMYTAATVPTNAQDEDNYSSV